MSNTSSWICSSCQRRVPPHVGVCRCGASRDTTGTGDGVADGDPPGSTAGSGIVTQLAGGALVATALFAAALWWSRTPGPAPVDSTRPAPTETVAPATADVAPSTVPSTEPLDRPAVAPAAATTMEPVIASVRPEPAHVGSDPGSSLEDIVAHAIRGVVMVEAAGSRGSGFFVAPEVVVTNAHVVGTDVNVTLRLHDGATRMARVERVRTDLDLALIRTAATPGGTTLTLGDPRAARVGQEVVAIGAALGLQNTVTRGIVSATRTSGAVSLIQTDAAINPGNSGGPLLDRRGAVLGVTTLKAGGAAEGLGFAVSVDHVRAFMNGASAPAGSSPAFTPAAAAPAVGDGLDASADGQRIAGTVAFERRLDQLSRQAAEVDAAWARMMRTCQVGPVAAADRPWLALATSPLRSTDGNPNCGAWLADLERASRAFQAALREASDEARRAGVYPGDERRLRRQYRLDVPGADR